MRRTPAALVGLGACLALLVASVPVAAEADPLGHKHYQTLLKAFDAVLKKPRPLEEKCTTVTGPTGDAAVDAILKPYRDRQAAIPDGATRFPIKDCRYSARTQGRDGRVIMMNPPADQIVRWIVSACTKPGARRAGLSEDACLAKAARMIWTQANAQFPITGYVPEPASTCADSPKTAKWASFGFRDGVGASLAGTPHEPGNPPQTPCGTEIEVAATCTTAAISAAQIDAALGARVTKLPKVAYARLSNLPLSAMAASAPVSRCPAADGVTFEWLTIARESYLAALGANRYSLLELWVGRRDDDPRFTCKKIGDKGLLGAC